MSSNYNLVKLWYFLHRHFLPMIRVPTFRPFTNSYITTVTTPLRIAAGLSAGDPTLEAIVRCHYAYPATGAYQVRSSAQVQLKVEEVGTCLILSFSNLFRSTAYTKTHFALKTAKLCQLLTYTVFPATHFAVRDEAQSRFFSNTSV
ncbi:DNA repair protein RAD5B [Fusarium oxysporum f. sp. albedinis]|nr:DNA repair protein RAD5B [Fusarium oxysporum f. sp. albedinis]